MGTLEFDEKKHLYRLDGMVIPSVTQIMKPLSIIKYDGISPQTLEKAAHKGTIVHNAIENHLKFGIDDCPEDQEGYFNAYLEWEQKRKPVVHGSEVRLYHDILRYAGTADLLAEIDGKLTLIDFKTSAAIDETGYPIQLEAYAQAVKQLTGEEVEAKIILWLKKDGSYEEVAYPAQDMQSWRIFGALKIISDYAGKYEK